MGVDLSCAQLLIRAKKNGVSFERTATLGRQGLHANRPALLSILRSEGYALSKDVERKLLDPTTLYAEEFFSLLGVKHLTAIDANEYEGAQIIHDMNRPIPDSMSASFDVVLDGGTLEHVFDFPTGIRNAVQMVAPNGHFLSFTVANNFSGHGFYQFSPELFYRLLCKENGYALESCIMWEEIQGTRFYQVPDPESVKSRIALTSQSGTYLLVQAKRIGSVSRDFVPQQSDYARHWESVQADLQSHAGKGGLRSALKNIPLLRAAVLFARGIADSDLFRPGSTEAEYSRRLLARNSLGFLKPLEDIRVKL